LDKVPGKYPYFRVTQISLQHSIGYVEGSLHAKNQLNPLRRFNRTPTCDGHTTQTHTQTKGHSIYRASIASHGMYDQKVTDASKWPDKACSATLSTMMNTGCILVRWQWLPESPRFDITRGMPDRAMATLERVARENGKPMPLGKLVDVVAEVGVCVICRFNCCGN